MNTFTRAEIMEINGYLTHEYRSKRPVRPEGLAARGLDAAELDAGAACPPVLETVDRPAPRGIGFLDTDPWEA
jgi:hypothetical protein